MSRLAIATAPGPGAVAAAVSPLAAAAASSGSTTPPEVRQRVRSRVISAVKPGDELMPVQRTPLSGCAGMHTAAETSATAAAQHAAARSHAQPRAAAGQEVSTPRVFLIRRRRELGQETPARPRKQVRRELFRQQPERLPAACAAGTAVAAAAGAAAAAADRGCALEAGDEDELEGGDALLLLCCAAAQALC